jgi:hypothetical protein
MKSNVVLARRIDSNPFAGAMSRDDSQMPRRARIDGAAGKTLPRSIFVSPML